MKILFLNPISAIGGAERVLLDLIASLRAAAPSVEIHLAATTEGPLREAAAVARGHNDRAAAASFPGVAGR